MGGGCVDGGRERWDVLLVSEGEQQGWPPPQRRRSWKSDMTCEQVWSSERARLSAHARMLTQ
jgi:hypothetical protein